MPKTLGFALALSLVGAAACGPASTPNEPPPATGDGPAAPALTFGAPPLPGMPPALAPHTKVGPVATNFAATEASAGSWKPILYTPSDTALPIPPSGDARNADLRRAMEIRSAPAAEWERTTTWWSAGAIRRWNEVARLLIAADHLSSADAARALAALGVAQYDAVVASRRLGDRFAQKTADPARLAAVGRGPVEQFGYPSQEAAIAQASADVLGYFFENDRRFLQQNQLAHSQSRIWMGAAMPSDVEAGRVVGRAAGAAVIAWLDSDNASKASDLRIERQQGKWYSETQTLPGFGQVKPWVMRSGDQFRAPAPPPTDSPEFQAALAEIRRYSGGLSGEQLAIAQYWNLGVGGVSVPGMWDQVALDLAASAGYSEARTARALALLNMAMMDACIASWETKFHYLVPRPSMVDAAIREPLGLPAHPSYTSGHSAFSGAAEGIISSLFPEAAAEMHRLAEEASTSRWYAGIHYRFDGDAGLKQGREVAAWVLSQRGAVDGAPPYKR